MLLLLERLVGRRRDQVRQVDRVVRFRHRGRDFGCDRRARLDVFLVEALDGAHVGLHLEALAHLVGDDFDLDLDERLELDEAHDARPLGTRNQHLHARRRLSHAVDLGNRPDGVQVGIGRVVHLRVLLRNQQDLLVFVHRGRDPGNRRPAADGERDDQLGEDDVVAQRHKGNAPQRRFSRVLPPPLRGRPVGRRERRFSARRAFETFGVGVGGLLRHT